jgi:hypothetical protein
LIIEQTFLRFTTGNASKNMLGKMHELLAQDGIAGYFFLIEHLRQVPFGGSHKNMSYFKKCI